MTLLRVSVYLVIWILGIGAFVSTEAHGADLFVEARSGLELDKESAIAAARAAAQEQLRKALRQRVPPPSLPARLLLALKREPSYLDELYLVEDVLELAPFNYDERQFHRARVRLEVAEDKLIAFQATRTRHAWRSALQLAAMVSLWVLMAMVITAVRARIDISTLGRFSGLLRWSGRLSLFALFATMIVIFRII